MAQLNSSLLQLLMIFYVVSFHGFNTSGIKCVKNWDKLRSEDRSCGNSCSRLPCKNPRAKCICDGPCGFVCVPPDLSCAVDLEDPVHGNFTTPNGKKYYALALYVCETGFDLIGPNTSICQSNGKWSGNPPFCTPEGIRCAPPTFEFEHAFMMYSTVKNEYYLGDQIQFTCDLGYYNSRGDILTSKCERKEDGAAWTPVALTCRPVSCRKPEDIDNGYYEGTGLILGSEITYHCNKGYYLIGFTTRVCLAERIWSSSEPRCEIITCLEPSKIKNGDVHFDNLHYLSSIRYTCNFGYVLDRSSLRQCDHFGQFTGDEPKCLEIDCGRPEKPNNGDISRLERTTLNNKVYYFCYEYTSMHGSREATCVYENKVARWSPPPPICIEHCQVPSIHNATFEYRTREIFPEDYIAHMESIKLNCDSGFEIIDITNGASTSGITLTCINVKWSDQIQCQPARCSIDDLNVEYLSAQHWSTHNIPHIVNNGDSIPLECDSAYPEVDATNFLSCAYGIWQLPNDEIKCRKKSCDVGLISFEHGQVFFYGKNARKLGKIYDGEYLELSCSKTNYELYIDARLVPFHSSHVFCNDGAWSYNQFECLPGRCECSVLEEKLIAKGMKPMPCDFDSGISSGRTVPLKCLEGYSNRTHRSAKCVNTKWRIDDDARCKRKCDCSALKLPASINLKKPCYDNLRSNSSLTLECTKYFSQYFGSKEAFCNEGDWIVDGFCHASCFQPKIPNSFIYGIKKWNWDAIIDHMTRIEIICKSGYHLESSENATVLLQCINGQYDNEIPKCIEDISTEQTTKVDSVEELLSLTEDVTLLTTNFPDKTPSYNSFLPHKDSLLAFLFGGDETVYPVESKITKDITNEDPTNLPFEGVNKTGFSYETTITKDITTEVPTNFPLVPNTFHHNWFNNELWRWTKIYLFRNSPEKTTAIEEHTTKEINLVDETTYFNIFPSASIDVDKNSLPFPRTAVEDITTEVPTTTTKIKHTGNRYSDRKCTYEPKDKNLLAYFKGKQLDDTKPTNISFNEVITFRCYEITDFLLDGDKSVKCNYLKWKGIIPTCRKLQLRSVENAPVITYEIEERDKFVDYEGTLHIPHDSKLSLRCWWFKINGNPKWKWNGQEVNFENAQQYWNNEEYYELEIKGVSSEHTGNFTCTSPHNKKTHGIDIKIDERPKLKRTTSKFPTTAKSWLHSCRDK